MERPLMGLGHLWYWSITLLALRAVVSQTLDDGLRSEITLSKIIDNKRMFSPQTQFRTSHVRNGTISQQVSSDDLNQHPQISTSSPIAVTEEEEQPTKIFSTGVQESFNAASCYAPNFRVSSVTNIFQPIDFGKMTLPKLPSHFIMPQKMIRKHNTIQTNKFYANLLLSDQKQPVYCMPYVVKWTGCIKNTTTCHNGIGISHTDENDVKYGPGDPAKFFYNPVDRHAVFLSANELGDKSELRTEDAGDWAITAMLFSSGYSQPLMRLPLLQGIGFITAIYSRATPVIGSLIGFKKDFVLVGRHSEGNIKYSLDLDDGTKWVMYILPSKGSSQPRFIKQNSYSWVDAVGNFSGIVQIAKIPRGDTSSSIYDIAAGTYAIDASIRGSVTGTTGMYVLSWKKAGITSQNLLMFALPHHVQSMSPESRAKLVPLNLRTTTKGVSRAILSNNMTLLESALPVDIQFYPQTSDHANNGLCLNSAKWRTSILEVAKDEIKHDIVYQIANQPSLYISGKLIASYARLVLTTFVLQDQQLKSIGLSKLKSVLQTWVSNKQNRTLAYDSIWGGVVAQWAWDVNDIRVEFGNAIYNDHNLQYGYWVFAAAVVAFLDPSWLQRWENKNWVNLLVRDYANPVADQNFPFSRAFDWYHGHSWATGLDAFPDGKSLESTSEDAHSLYAIKLWGHVIGDEAMVARANLQLAIFKRSLQNYFLMESSNIQQPRRFIGNKAAGILFDNKVDHNTWFGTNHEYIHGIHMLPWCPISTYTRSKKFTSEEWNQFFNNYTPKDQSWTGILRGNQALIDPKKSFDFFASSNFKQKYLREGDSRAYYLWFGAILGQI